MPPAPLKPWAQPTRHRRRPPSTIPSQSYSNSASIGYYKSQPTIYPVNLEEKRPYTGQCCSCMPISETLGVHTDDEKFIGYKDLLQVDELHSSNPWWVRKCAHLMSLHRRKSFFYEDVSMKILASERIMDAISITTGLNPNQLENGTNEKKLVDLLQKRAKAILYHMKSRVSSVLVKITGWFLYKILGSVFLSMQVKQKQLLQLKRICHRDLPVVFLPSHRSHLDYILLTYICYNINCQLPQIAAGNNLDLPIVRHILRRWGAFYIRRKIDHSDGSRDHLYRAVLQQYLVELLRSGQTVEFFLEGGRTRTGRCLSPKGGLVSVVVDAFYEGAFADAYIIPVSFSYEKLPEGSFAAELMGSPKRKESLFSVIVNLLKFFCGSFGHVRVNFTQAYSLREYLKVASSFPVPSSVVSQLPSPSLTPSSSPVSLNSTASMTSLSSLVSEEHRQVVQSLIDHVIYDTSRSQALMSTHVLAFLLLYKFESNAVTLEQLANGIQWLQEEVNGCKRDTGFSGNAEDVVEHAMKMLGKKLLCQQMVNGKRMISHSKKIESILELNYYANSVVTVFVLESLLVLSINACSDVEQWMSNDPDVHVTVQHAQVLNKAEDLYVILEKEFPWLAPCCDISSQLNKALERLQLKEILIHHENVKVFVRNTQYRDWNNHALHDLVSWEEESDECGDFITDPVYEVNLTNKQAMQDLRFYQSLLLPILETYSVTAGNLHLLEENAMLEKSFITEMCKILKERVNSHSSQAQVISSESIGNALKCFAKLQILTSSIENGHKCIHINPNAKETVVALNQVLSQYYPHIN